MEAWISERFSDEEGGAVAVGKLVIIRGNKSDMKAIASFMSEVVKYLDSADSCHMHLRDSMEGWSKANHIDIEVTVEGTA